MCADIVSWHFCSSNRDIGRSNVRCSCPEGTMLYKTHVTFWLLTGTFFSNMFSGFMIMHVDKSDCSSGNWSLLLNYSLSQLWACIVGTLIPLIFLITPVKMVSWIIFTGMTSQCTLYDAIRPNVLNLGLAQPHCNSCIVKIAAVVYIHFGFCPLVLCILYKRIWCNKVPTIILINSHCRWSYWKVQLYISSLLLCLGWWTQCHFIEIDLVVSMFLKNRSGLVS